MSNARRHRYVFGPFVLLPDDKQLLHDGQPVALAPKAFDTLLLLVQNQSHLVDKETLLRQLWPDSIVEEVAVAHSVSQVRKALRSGRLEIEYIETVPKRGYRFVAPVEIVAHQLRIGGATRLAVLPFENLSSIPNANTRRWPHRGGDRGWPHRPRALRRDWPNLDDELQAHDEIARHDRRRTRR
jgi:DNA-binding winged helix-turn-helix (wHTH) protein